MGETLLKHNKRGQLAIDMVTIIIIFIIVSFSFIIGYKALKEINDDFQLDTDFSATAKDNLQGVTTQYPIYMDNAFLIMLILFWIILIVSTLFINANPIFFIVSVLLLIVVFMVGMSMSNAYGEVMSDGELVLFSDSFPKINFVMNNLLMVLIVMGLTASIALYAKSQSGGIT